MIYLSDKLPEFYPSFHRHFTKALNDAGEQYDYLTGTADVWCRDYMPVKTRSGKFVQFTYDPSYLSGIDEYKTDPAVPVEALGLNIFRSYFTLDGGNVTFAGGKVFITIRAFGDNWDLEKEWLEHLFDMDVVLVLVRPNDFTAHTDGIIAGYNDDTVLVTEFLEEEQEYADHIFKTLQKAGLKWITLPSSANRNRNYKSAKGEYINFYKTAQSVFVPIFKRPEDEIALRLFEELFPQHSIFPVFSNELAKDGGLLHCVTWEM